MEKLPHVPVNLGKSEGTNTTRPSTNFLRVLPPTERDEPPLNAQLEAAKAATERLFRLLPKSDVGREFMAMTVKVFADYPPDIMMQAVEKIVVTNSYPDLPYINDTCAKIYEPRRRDEEREHLASERKRALPPPREKRTAEEQARAEAQVAAIRKDFAIPEGGIVKPQQALPVNHDGRNISRIWVDLEQRKVRNAMRHEQGNEVSDGV